MFPERLGCCGHVLLDRPGLDRERRCDLLVAVPAALSEEYLTGAWTYCGQQACHPI
jgi:hypothetical protein